MKKYIAHVLAIGTLFFGLVSSAMDHPSLADIIAESRNLRISKDFEPTTRNHFVRVAAQEYNQGIPLIGIAKELYDSIFCNFVNIKDPMEDNVKNILALSATCTHFNNKLEALGNMLQCYDQETKNETLVRIIENMCNFTYWNKRRSALLLVFAGAEHNKCHYLDVPLIEQAINNNDIDTINILFQYGANANLRILRNGNPIFVKSKTPEMAQVFVDNGADLNLSGHRDPNVLWYCLTHYANKPELFQFYIDKKANPTILDRKKRSLLHDIALSWINDNNKSLKTVTILLNKIGDMINTADDDGNTPLDLLVKSSSPKKNIIALFKEHGAKTSQELMQKN